MTLFLEIKCAFLAIFENHKTDLCQIFLGFGRKHLFITTCIEKQQWRGNYFRTGKSAKVWNAK